MASTRARLYIDDALSNDEPSCVQVCEVCADATDGNEELNN